MTEHTAEQVREKVDAVYRFESRRICATLVRLLGDFELAEDALHDAFGAALERWPKEGVPANPRAWLVSTGRFKAIDAIRRRARFDPLEEEHAESVPRAGAGGRRAGGGGAASRSKMTACASSSRTATRRSRRTRRWRSRCERSAALRRRR